MHLFPGPPSIASHWLEDLLLYKHPAVFYHCGLCYSWIIGVLYDTSGIALLRFAKIFRIFCATV